MKNLPQLVLFDLDDTLFDHQNSRRCGLVALQKEYPPLANITLSELVAEHQYQIAASYNSALDGTTSLRQNRIERFRNLFVNCGIEIDSLEAERAVQRYRKVYETHRRAVPGVAALLQYLKDRTHIGVVTNGLTSTQKEKLQACDLDRFVDFLLTSEEAGIKKSDKRIFLQALDMARINREHAVFIGDSWALDIVGAHGVGIQSIWLNREQEKCPDAGLTNELTSFEPLERTLKALRMVL